jgi:secondary thiamine-phosphate synthase enzyme
MEATAPASRIDNSSEHVAAFHQLLHITTTREAEFVDITDRLRSIVARSGIGVGILNVQALHTTTGIVLNEHEPLLLGDFESALERLAPRAARYQHDDFDRRTVNVTVDERVNGHAHCRALLLAGSVSLNIAAGGLITGRWQRVLLAELDGPRDRVVSVVAFGQAATSCRGRARTSSIEDRFREALDR